MIQTSHLNHCTNHDGRVFPHIFKTRDVTPVMWSTLVTSDPKERPPWSLVIDFMSLVRDSEALDTGQEGRV